MNRDFFVLDSTISRTKESLRVLEDIARFSLSHPYSADEFRQIRHTLFSLEHRIGVGGLISSRSTTVSDEEERNGFFLPNQTLWSLVRVNVARVTESFRVLEEFVRLYHPSIAKDVEDLRYKVYSLEKIVLSQTPQYSLYQYFEEGIVCPMASMVDDLTTCIDKGAKMVVLRDVESPKHLVYAKAKQLCLYLQEQRLAVGNTDPVLLLLAGHVDLAVQLPVDGVHLEQGDVDVQQARWKLGSKAIIGRANSTIEELAASVEYGVDYVTYGPIFAHEGQVAVGTTQLAEIVDRLETPFAVCGGIQKDTADAVYSVGIRNLFVEGADSRAFF
ncbi:MAG: hypothetical protein GW939_02735 [Candidatus Magasanikbacteria bacterium]|nr:hypothetical protein [Candidatus Magasanikbacteria bacterium]